MNTLFQNILTASFHGSIVILAVMLLRLVLKKTPRKYICLLWLLAGLRLLMPFQIQSDLSLQPSADPDFPELWNDAYRLRAQVDVLMPGGNAFGDPTMDPSALESLRKEKGLTLGEMQRSAKNVLKLCARLKG